MAPSVTSAWKSRRRCRFPAQRVAPYLAPAATTGRSSSYHTEYGIDVTRLIPQDIYAWKTTRQGVHEFHWSGWQLLPEERDDRTGGLSAHTGRCVLAGVIAWRDPSTAEDIFVHALVTEAMSRCWPMSVTPPRRRSHLER